MKSYYHLHPSIESNNDFVDKKVDLKEIKCPLLWCEKHEAMFPTVGFLTR